MQADGSDIMHIWIEKQDYSWKKVDLRGDKNHRQVPNLTVTLRKSLL